MKIAYSRLAEVSLEDFDFTSYEEQIVDNWMRDNCTFKHSDSYEFIIHLYPDESQEWFVKNKLSGRLPGRVIDVILEVRKTGAARICFYS
jgi:hypothetical protein